MAPSSTRWNNNPITPSSPSLSLASIRSYLLLVFALLLIGERSTQALQVKAWTPCSAQTTTESSIDPVAECTIAVVPLCYADVCGAPVSSETKTITLSLKRIPARVDSSASSATASRPRHLWVIPDRSDIVLPSDVNEQLQKLYHHLGGQVSVYTLDQRGTGQSTRLSCNASSSSAFPTTSNSFEQLQECLQNLDAQYDIHLAAFSITSAAYDLVTLISQTQTKSDVVVYGLGYGTLAVERLLHLGAAEIKGYVLDGSATTSGAKQSDFAHFSKADADFGRVGDEFLTLCESDPACSSKFAEGGNISVSEILKGVLENIDSSRCATLWMNEDGDGSILPASAYPVSYNVRRTLAMLMQNSTERAFIPVVIYRLNRCNAHDQQVLRSLVMRLQKRERELASHSELVYDLQAFSELWEENALLPTQSALVARFTESLISPGRAVDQLPEYCVFAGDTTSEACASLRILTLNSPRFTYAHDKYWNVGATIPAHASVLLLNGKLDGQSPLKHASLLADALQGSAKKLLVFDSATHNVLADQESVDGGTFCGLEILGSYILNNGALGALNTACVKQLPPVNFQITNAMSLRVLNATDAHDGGFSASSGAGPNTSPTPAPALTVANNEDPPASEKRISYLENSRDGYKLAFIVVLTLLVLVLLLAIVVLYRWQKRKQLKHEEDQLRQMRGEAVDDLELLRHIYLSSPEAWANEYAMFNNERVSGAHSNEAQKASSTTSARPLSYTRSDNNGNSSSKESKSPPGAWIC